MAADGQNAVLCGGNSLICDHRQSIGTPLTLLALSGQSGRGGQTLYRGAPAMKMIPLSIVLAAVVLAAGGSRQS